MINLIINNSGIALQRTLTSLFFQSRACQLLPIDFAVNMRKMLPFYHVLFYRIWNVLLLSLDCYFKWMHGCSRYQNQWTVTEKFFQNLKHFISQQAICEVGFYCVFSRGHILGCVMKSIAERSAPFSLFGTCKTTSEVLYLVWVSPDRWRHWHTGVIPVDATRLVKGLEHVTWEDRLTEQDRFSLGNRRLGEYYCSLWLWDWRTQRRWIVVGQEGTRTSYLLGRRIFTMRVVKYWKRLPREAVISSASEMFRNQMDMSLCNLI